MSNSIELKHEEVTDITKLKGQKNENIQVSDEELNALREVDKNNEIENSLKPLKEEIAQLDTTATNFASKRKEFIEKNITFQTLEKKGDDGKNTAEKHYLILGSGDTMQRFEYSTVFDKDEIITKLMKDADQIAEHIAGAKEKSTNELEIKIKNQERNKDFLTGMMSIGTLVGGRLGVKREKEEEGVSGEANFRGKIINKAKGLYYKHVKDGVESLYGQRLLGETLNDAQNKAVDDYIIGKGGVPGKTETNNNGDTVNNNNTQGNNGQNSSNTAPSSPPAQNNTSASAPTQNASTAPTNSPVQQEPKKDVNTAATVEKKN